jgi:putative ABC transport system substrate-binding protein
MMVRVASGHFAGNVNLGGIAEAFAFVPCMGTEAFFIFRNAFLIFNFGRRKRRQAFHPPLSRQDSRPHLPPKSKRMENDVMKKNTLKKLMALGCAAALSLSLIGCSGGSDSANDTSAETTEETTDTAGTEASDTAGTDAAAGETAEYTIAIVKQMDHASLDEIANAVAAELDAIAAENGVTINYEIYSGQNDQTTLKQIGDQAVADGVDAIIPVATLAAQVMTVCAEDTQTPVVYAAISDPEAAEMTGIDYVTGTSDALNTELILDMMLAANPDVQNVGLLYSLSETNSTKPIADAKAYLEEKSIAYTEQTANTNDEVIAAASALIADNVDAIFTPTDNVIMAAELAIYEDLAAAGIPHYTGADSFVRNGAFATCGVNYTNLGTETADLAYTAITEGMDGLEDYYLSEGGIITVNTETAEALGIDYSVFSDLGEVVEVQTTEE